MTIGNQESIEFFFALHLLIDCLNTIISSFSSTSSSYSFWLKFKNFFSSVIDGKKCCYWMGEWIRLVKYWFNLNIYVRSQETKIFWSQMSVTRLLSWVVAVNRVIFLYVQAERNSQFLQAILIWMRFFMSHEIIRFIRFLVFLPHHWIATLIFQ